MQTGLTRTYNSSSVSHVRVYPATNVGVSSVGDHTIVDQVSVGSMTQNNRRKHHHHPSPSHCCRGTCFSGYVWLQEHMDHDRPHQLMREIEGHSRRQVSMRQTCWGLRPLGASAQLSNSSDTQPQSAILVCTITQPSHKIQAASYP
jgi:hypothetical protein